MRRLAPLALLSALLLAAPAAHAQEEAPAEGEEGGGKGSPIVAYVGAGFLIAGGMFILCKSARR